MWAIVEIASKQYRVKKGDIVNVDRLQSSRKEVSFDTVLLTFDGKKATFGAPYIKSARVKAKIVDEVKAQKVTIYKFKRRKKYRRKKGHRQIFTRLQVTEVK